MSDNAIYVTFTHNGGRSTVVATKGHTGPEVARLTWNRRLSHVEEVEIAAAIRTGMGQ
jgi:hypothetical protein